MSNEDNSSCDSDSGCDQDLTLPPESASASVNDETLVPGESNDHSDCENRSKDFGDYLLQEEIARGGMGVVYRARQSSLDREVAIKMILAGQFASQEEVDRFYTEATAAAKLDHPNIVPVYDVGEIDGHHFFSMKLIEGSDLGAKLTELRNDLPASVEILRKVCDAVHHAHQRGILHRDLKPGNILLDHENEPYVTDLGLARRFKEDSRLTQTGAIIGTPSYMPPEQASGSTDITTSADIYSLGAILYEILTGRPPFREASPVETMMKVISDLPERPSSLGSIDRGLESICMKCLAKEPRDRYISAADLSRDLNCWINGEPISVRATSLANATRFWLKQNFGSAIWAVVIGPLLGVVSSLSLWYSTIGQETEAVFGVYDKLPSAAIPFTLSPGSVPRWTQLPLIILFLLSIVFVGYVTARFVKPKHRGADLAAGTTVGFVASIAAFIFAIGPLCLMTSLRYDDVKYSLQIALQKNETTPSWILEEYPELEAMERGDQVQVLADKNEADHFFQIPAGIWTGVFVSLAIYFFPSLFETAVAGPLFRKKKGWFSTLLGYLEITFPIVTLMILFALSLSTWVILGGIGFRWTSRLALLFALIAMAIIAGRMQWKLPIRIVTQLLFAMSFVWFCAVDFPSIPGVADCNRRVATANQAIRKEPYSFSARARLVNSHLTYAQMLQQNGRADESLGFLDRAIEEADRFAELAAAGKIAGGDESTIHQFQAASRLSKVRALIKQDELDEAETLLKTVREKFPEIPSLDEFEGLIKDRRGKLER